MNPQPKPVKKLKKDRAERRKNPLPTRVKKAKVVTIKSAKKKADTAFSIVIRTRDSVDGICTCATCGRKIPIKSAHAGHFLSRRHTSTRYDERNVNAQCYSCNIGNKGEQYLHSLFVDNKYGAGTALLLKEIASQIKQMKVLDYIEIEEKYNKMLSEIKSVDI